MVQRKLIGMLGAVALLAMTAGTSQASLSRVEGMGLSAPYTSQFTDDYANIFYFPTSVVRQNNLVLAELGNDPNGNVNSASALDKSYTVIRNFPRFGAIAFQMKQSALNATSASNNLNNEQLDMIWGKAFTNLDFAVRLDITNSYFEYSDNAPSGFKARGNDLFWGFDPYPFGAVFGSDVIQASGVELNTWGISPALALHMKNDDRLEMVASYRRYTLDRSSSPAPGETWKDGGNASYVAAARAILHRGDTHTWYPAAWYVNDDLSWEVTGVTPTARSADETYKNFGAGISDNMRVNDNNLLLWGVVVSQSKHQYDRTDNNDAVPSGATKTLTQKTTAIPMVFAAIETDATSWLKLRIGASRGHMMYKEEGSDFAAPTNTYTIKERNSDFNMSIGSGIRWNNLDIDMVINDQFPLTGGWVLSGNERAPFNRVSATYHF